MAEKGHGQAGSRTKVTLYTGKVGQTTQQPGRWAVNLPLGGPTPEELQTPEGTLLSTDKIIR